MKLAGQTILITGGGSGIGLALAKQLAGMDNQVIIVGRDFAKLEAAQREVPSLATYSCDISQEEERLRLAEWVYHNYPKLSVLFNNAGIQLHTRFDLKQLPSLELLQQEMDTNFTAVIRLSSLFLPLLRQRPEAAIINVTSGLALAPKQSAPIYCASKAALSSFTRTLRYQLESTAVQVVEAMAPMVDTDMTAGRGKGKISPQQFAREVIRGIQQGRAVIHGGKVKLLYLLHRLIPELTYRIMRHG